ncbi:hypothetical protein F4810DRAFT_248435 [Camillea tinctor]|nr:hypothetical protein F4810DRAFT_248435 [Camillea tinctor]
MGFNVMGNLLTCDQYVIEVTVIKPFSSLFSFLLSLLRGREKEKRSDQGTRKKKESKTSAGKWLGFLSYSFILADIIPFWRGSYYWHGVCSMVWYHRRNRDNHWRIPNIRDVLNYHLLSLSLFPPIDMHINSSIRRLVGSSIGCSC